MKSTVPLLLLSLLLLTCKGTDPKKQQPPTSALDVVEQVALPGSLDRAVVLVLDGTRVEESFGFQQTAVGVSDAAGTDSEDVLASVGELLLPRGGHAVPAFSTGVTITAPSHVTFLQGRRRHYGSPPHDEEGGTGLYRGELPTLFELLRAQGGDAEPQPLLVSNAVHMVGLEYSLHPGYGENFGAEEVMLTKADGVTPTDDDSEVLAAVRAALTEGRRLVVANLHNIDRTAHNVPEDYASAVMAVDDPIVEFWRWIQSDDSGLKDRTLLIVMADHGRHRFDDLDPVWEGHGDDCSGCREIPMFLIGPGVTAGASTTRPYTHEDAHQTLAWLLGIDSPYSTGLVMTDLLNIEETPVQRTGDASPVRSGTLTASLRWLDTPEHRSQIVVDGEVLSGADVFAAEAPVVFQGSRDYACWRELALQPGEDYFPWTVRCVVRDDAASPWVDIGGPLSRVPPDGAVSLVEDEEGNLLLALSDLLLFDTINIGTNSWISLATWNGTGWTLAEEHSGDSYAIEPSLVGSGSEFWLAYARGANIPQGRYTRHIELERIQIQASGSQLWRPVWSSLDDPNANLYGRMEHPVLWTNDAQVRLAFYGFTEAGTVLLQTSTAEESWTPMTPVDDQQPLSHVLPAWSPEGALFWARAPASATTEELCRLLDGETSCISLDVVAIEQIAPISAQEVVVSVQGREMVWALETVTF